jgi:hypothetical protein
MSEAVARGVQPCEDIAQLFRVLGGHATRVFVLMETSQPFVAD